MYLWNFTAKNTSSAVAILVLLLSPAILFSQSASRELTADEYTIYATVLRLKHGADRASLVVVVKGTSPIDLDQLTKEKLKNLQTELRPVTAETLGDFASRNRDSKELRDEFKLPTKVRFITERAVDEVFRQQGVRKGWEWFYQEFPGADGFVEFSGVGFDSKKTQALVFVSHHCGGLCGSGIYYVLVKENAEWKIKNEHLVWVS